MNSSILSLVLLKGGAAASDLSALPEILLLILFTDDDVLQVIAH